MRSSYMSISVLTTMCLVVSSSAAEPTDPDVFRSDIARLELRKPSGWHFQSLESAIANRAQVEMNDEEFQKAIESMAGAPLVVATKHPEPCESLNPSFQVIVRPAGRLEGKTGTEILGLVEPTLKAQFADFTALDAIREITVSGQKAGRMTTRYTLKTQDGREFPVQATLIMIPRGKVLYQLGLSGPAEGPDKVAEEVEAVLASVRFIE